MNLVIFGRAVGFGFVNYDDPAYAAQNPVVLTGLNPTSMHWAFTHYVGAHWVPLTMLSHMLDCELYGGNAAGHHATSVLLHGANALILFLLLVRLTGVLWPSLLVAALFSLHPLRVESVAWVAERKDVLSGFMFLLTIWMYARYTERRGWQRYLLLSAVFAAGLLAKSMLVTLPFVLLLLDFWPLGRLRLAGAAPASPAHPGLARSSSASTSPVRSDLGPSSSPRTEHARSSPDPNGPVGIVQVPFVRLALEKLPLIGLAAVDIGMTIVAQRAGGALIEDVDLPLSVRLANGAIAYVRYLALTLWPHKLAVFYPYDTAINAVQVAGAVGFLCAVTLVSLYLAKQRPAFIVGWLWYLGMLVPVSGIVQSGAQPYADRYTYLPSIGLAIAFVHGLLVPVLVRLSRGGDAASERAREEGATSASRTSGALARAGRTPQSSSLPLPEAWIGRPPALHSASGMGAGGGVVVVSATAACLVLGALTWRQTGFWRDSITLFDHAVRVTERNGLAHYNLGCALANAGRTGEAIAQYREAIRIRPDDPSANHNLGISLLGEGKLDEAIEHLRRAVDSDPAYGDAHLNLGVALAMKGRIDEATIHLTQATRLMPTDPVAFYNLGLAQQKLGRTGDATLSFRQALQIDPRYSQAADELRLLSRTPTAPPAVR